MINDWFRICLGKLTVKVDVVTLLSWALLFVFLGTILTCYYFPLYPDEIQVRISLSRLPFDYPLKISGTPTCVSNFAQTIPVVMYLPGFVNWILHGNLESIKSLRVVGVIIPFAWIAVLGVFLRNKVFHGLIGDIPALAERRWVVLTGVMITIFSIGVLPFSLISNRNEQLIFPSIVLLLWISTRTQKLKLNEDLWRKNTFVIMYFFAVSLILYGHAKGLFLTPFFIAVGWQLFSTYKNRLVLILLTILLSLLVISYYDAWKEIFQCNDNPKISEIIKGFSIDPSLLFSDPFNFLFQSLKSLLNFGKYLVQLGFQQKTDINYLPPVRLGFFAKVVNFFIWINVTCAFYLICKLLLQYCWSEVTRRQFLSINTALLALLLSLIIGGIFNLPKNWYDAGYFYTLMVIIGVFFIANNYVRIPYKLGAKKIYIYLGCVALTSQMVLIYRNMPAFLNGYVGPSISVVNYQHSNVISDIRSAAYTCGIDPIHSKRLIVDDYTYLYFRKSNQPMAVTYIFYDSNVAAAESFISNSGSDGLITRCTSISAYASLAKKAGGICCIAKKDLEKVSSLMAH